MQALERHDEWARAHLQVLLRHKQVSIPPPYRMLRPGEEEPTPASRVETDPAVIAAFFKQHFS